MTRTAGVGPVDRSAIDISVRPLTERDLPALAEMWRRCGPRSRAARFHAAVPLIPAGHLTALLTDPASSFVAVHGPTGAVVALASLVGNRDGGSADLGVLVEDGWQRLGIARRLVTPLVLAAPDRGINAITAEIFAEHGHVGRLLRRIPGELSSVHNGATATVTVRLPRTAAQPG
jgi:GNAT superfamily N-acetyltransferase